ncbi:MAG: N(4)-(beta-N-acetylglucosaminyl)-L-asparaginase [Candidatus Kryptonium sp.]|nr:N(4)-(beta-N-acetylglucosaminyl)-L-asparaginase [Candidatus Kryptonium sp.]MCX7761459.1 N(4)-(beta-N-acetylglucosaminyl)-L-asparaginase [Candidatus Kryptonium sp.]MDW8109686.1 N(4)-(beta-N-acetylglucosaminyl)-L-asparaginase [Candidatus Kryptonium sp.]
MVKRREFLKSSLLAGIGAVLAGKFKIFQFAGNSYAYESNQASLPILISTWRQGIKANEMGVKVLSEGGTALDAVELGVRTAEDDPSVMSVGYGGLPDECGHVSLDACIMDWEFNAGAVAFVQKCKNPVSVARKVMELTKHVFIVGEGADRFAKLMGFPEVDLLTDEARKRWLEWRRKMSQSDNWLSPEENHDTIAMLALDKQRRVAGAVTTSGLAWKIHGRVGDSPIIGAGLYVDGEVGAAGSTGVGEAVIRTCGSFLVVEYMRNGMHPQKAVEETLKRVLKVNKKWIDKDPNFQVAFIAVNLRGEIGAMGLRKGFQYALYKDGKNQFLDAPNLI